MGLSDEEVTPATPDPCPACGVQATPVLDMPFPSERELEGDTFHRFCVLAPRWWTCAKFLKGGVTLERRRR